MRIIHTADIHLGSPMDSKFPKEIAEVRRGELRKSFANLADYARDNGVKAVMLCGDVFDRDQPYKKDKDFFYSVVKSHPMVDFLYLRGNHDREASYEGVEIPNLKLFGTSWTKYSYENVDIYGIESCEENAVSMYATLELDPGKINIVMMHGQVSDVPGKDLVCIPKLRNRNINYLALGHIHMPSYTMLDERGVYAYSGCLEPRGFDELGQHFFNFIGANGKFFVKRVDGAERQILEYSVDISGLKDAYAAAERVKAQVQFNPKFIYRVNLTGEVDCDTDLFEDDVYSYLKDQCFFLIVRDRTKKKIDLASYEKDMSLKGEFVRYVTESGDFTDEEKQMIVHCGLRVLEGEDCDL
ncbi:MAG: DNA repair exonuclease [Clostridia bacterium]|nr:DNA repair exonuclease [Clostridia bacterium]